MCETRGMAEQSNGLRWEYSGAHHRDARVGYLVAMRASWCVGEKTLNSDAVLAVWCCLYRIIIVEIAWLFCNEGHMFQVLGKADDSNT